MKKSIFMFLSLITSICLTSCNQTSSTPISSTTPIESNSSESSGQETTITSSSSSSSSTEVTFEEKYATLCNVNLSLVTSYSVAVIDYEEDSFTGEADCIFNENAYSVSNPGTKDTPLNYSYTLFSGTYTIQGTNYVLATEHYIDADNKAQSEPFVEGGYYYEFASFTNPFTEDYIDLFNEDEEGIISLDTTSKDGLDLAQYYVFLTTGFYPEGFEYFNLVANEERITSIAYQTTQYDDDYLGSIIIEATSTIDELARVVKDVEPYPTRTYSQTLLTACNNFEANGHTSEIVKTAKEGVTITEDDEYAMHMKISWDNNVLHSQDLTDPENTYEVGYVVKDDAVRELIHNDDNTYSYNGYDDIYTYDSDYNMVQMTSLDLYLPERITPVEAFEYDEANDNYYLTGDNALYFFLYYNYAYYSADSYNLDISNLVLKLSEDKTQIAEIDVETSNFDYVVTYSDLALPFSFDTLTKYDPAPLFNGTYTCSSCTLFGEGTVTVVINNVENGERSLTINGTSYECSYSTGNFYFTYNDVTYYFVRTYDGGLALYQSMDSDEGDNYIDEFEAVTTSEE